MKHDAALVQPGVLKFHLMRRCGRVFVQQPKALPFCKFLRKIGEDVGEDFAFSPLGAANAGEPCPLESWIRRGHSRLRRQMSPSVNQGPLTDGSLSLVVLFQDVERVAMMQL